MLELILGLLSNPTVLAIGGGLVAILVAFFKGRTSGAQKERAKQVAKDRKAREERLEMHREATDAERRAGEFTDEEALKEALKWAKR